MKVSQQLVSFDCETRKPVPAAAVELREGPDKVVRVLQYESREGREAGEA